MIGIISLKALLLIGTLLSGGFSMAMVAIGLWILWQDAVGRLTLSRPGAISAMVALGVMGVVLSGLYYALGKQNLTLQQRDADHAAELERALRRLQDSDTKFRAVIENSKDVIFIKDLEGRYVLMNPAGCALLGRRPEEILGKHDSELLHPVAAQQMQAHDREVLEAKVISTFEDRVIGPDGAAHDFVTTKQPYLTPEGRIIGVIGASHEITRQKQLDQELRESEERYRSLVELSPEAIMVEKDGILTFSNPAGARLLGAKDPREVVGLSLLDFIHPDDVERFQRRIRQIREDREPIPLFEKRIVRFDGQVIDVEFTASPIVEHGELAVLSIIRDITARKRALKESAQRKAELQKILELNQLKDHFLSTLSHEMKTPLSLICGYAELLEEKYPQESLLLGILDGSRRLSDHISNMLDYSAMVSGTLSLYPTEVNLAELLHNAHAAVEETLRLKHLHFSADLDPETPSIQADPRRISQMLGELLSNAIKFTPEGGSLGIRVRPEAGHVRLEVWDTGPGISESQREQIWTAFTQLAVSDAFRKGGLGLGLTIVKKIAELHGGDVQLESEVGKGSRFVVRLPIKGTPEPRLRISRLEAAQEQPSPESPAP